MSIRSVNTVEHPLPATTAPARSGNGPDFAALAASLARGDLGSARAAVATSAASASSVAPMDQQGADGALHASVFEGNFAAARVMLALHEALARHAAPTTRIADATDTDKRVRNDADTGSAPASATPPAPAALAPALAPVAAPALAPVAAHGRAANIVDVGATSDVKADVDVGAVLLALATGNAGNIPAEVINRYGPGGELYDPAAIMDAYRASALGRAQMASMAWIGKPA